MTRIVLVLGMTGAQVRVLQQRLSDLGHAVPSVEVDKDVFGPATRDALRAWQAEQGLAPTGIVDETTAERLRLAPASSTPTGEGEGEGGGGGEGGSGSGQPKEFEFLVRGQVMYRRGLPIPAAVVRAFDKDLREEHRLAEGHTDASGNFELWYSAGQLRCKRNADLVVRAFLPDQLDVVAAESRVIYSAQTVEKVRLQVDGGPDRTWSEYEQLVSEVAPMLGHVRLDQLGETAEQPDISYLSGRTGQSAQRVAALAVGHKLAARADLPGEVMYGLARMGAVTNLSGLLAQSPAVLRRMIDAGVAGGFIPGRFADKTDDLLAAFRSAAGRHALAPSPAPGRFSLGQLLSTTIDDAKLRADFVTRYVDHRGSMVEFWKAIAEVPALAKLAGTIQRTLQLGALTDNHLPLVVALEERFATGALRSIRDLAGFDQAAWEKLIRELPGDAAAPASVPGDDVATRTQLYAATIRRVLDDTMPTETVAFRAAADRSFSDDVRRFFSNVVRPEATFDLLRSDVRRLVAGHPELLEGVKDREATITRVLAMQRVFRLAPRYDAMTALLDAGYDSGFAIAQADRTAFVEELMAALGGHKQAQLTYNLGSQTAAAALNLLASASPMMSPASPRVTPPPAPSGIPSLQELFGSLDLCACRDCRSVFSPAAYLAEILAFLKEREVTRGGHTVSVRDILFERRRDLGDIELSCDNTNTRLPYVDLVNELLENTVVPFTGFALAGGLVADLDANVRSDALIAAFAAGGIVLDPASSRVVVVNPGASWFISDHTTLYVIELHGGIPRVVRVGYQTSGTAEALAANPQHQNDAAYGRLTRAAYPWSLPFDLPIAESRTYLEHLGVPRWQVMEDLVATRAGALVRVDIATELLGMTPVERELVTGGRAVRLATVGPVALSGTPNVDGVATAIGDLVLVKSQAAAADNGIYTVAAAAWLRSDETTAYVVVGAGATLAGTRWLLGGTAAERFRPWQLWGLAEHANQIEVFDPSSGKLAVQPLDWLDALAQVRVLGRIGLAYEDVIDALEARFVNGAGAIRIGSADPEDLATCDTAKLVLEGLDAAAVDRLYRFVRLWRKTGWSMRELDQLVMRFGAAIDDAAIVRMSHVQRIRDASGLDVDAILAFWDTIEMRGDDPPALYARLFQNPSVIQPVDVAFALAGNELAIVGTSPADAKLSMHAPTIVAALGTSAEDLARLTAALGGDDLTLANLSWLYRRTLLARAAGLDIDELLALVTLAGIDPFDPAHTENALLFLELAAAVRASGISVARLDYILRHQLAPASDDAPSEDAIAEALGELRRALQKVQDDTAPVADPHGEVTQRRLASLQWAGDTIARAIEVLTGAAAFDTVLAALPGDLAIPAALAARVSYDAVATRLRVVGPLTNTELAALAGASADPAWGPAVTAIHAAPRDFVTTSLKAFAWPTFSIPLAALPAGVVFPRELKNRIYDDAPAATLRFHGAMTDGERATLSALSADAAYLAAIAALAAAPAAYAPPPDNTFLVAADAAALFDAATTAEARFALVLDKLLAYLRTTGSTQAIIRWLATAFALETRVAEALVVDLVGSIATPGAKAIADFLAPAFATSHPSVPLTHPAFPAQFETYIRLDKAASILASLRIADAELGWLRDDAATVPPRQIPWLHVARTVGWLSFDDLPVAPAADGTAWFAAWLRLVALSKLRDQLPHGDDALTAVFALARTGGVTAAELWTELATRTGWAAADIASAAAVLGLVVPGDLRDETGVAQIRTVIRRAKHLGASVDQCRAWARPELAAADARAIRSAAKAKYTERDWLAVAKPLRDVLREKQRAALVDYLVARPDPAAGQTWRDIDGLYAHLLIDVQMSPCMLTSRIKQAISSVQLFVQRTFLNLERDHGVVADSTADSAWRQWDWMKMYVLWEANRKVFLYPENWLEPELRADKTALFRALESSLLQGEVTDDSARAAFSTYLESLDGCARLEVTGLYQQDAISDQPSVLHVFARTRDGAPAYYYRRRVAEGRWSEWERLEVDITERQILPIVWSSRLFVFWPEFTATQDAQPIGDKPAAATKRWQLQLAWTERRHDKWTAKKLTPQKIQSNLQPDDGAADQGKAKHTFRAAFDGAGLRVWYEYDVPERTVVVNPRGYYGAVMRTSREATVTGWFFTGCDGRIELFDRVIHGVFPPTGTRIDAMYFTETPSSPLMLPKAHGGKTEDSVLQTTPGTFSLAYAHQDGAITARRPFFYQDSTKSFFVTPTDVSVSVAAPMSVGVLADPAVIDVIRNAYYTGALASKIVAARPFRGVARPVPIAVHRANERRATRMIAAGTLPVEGTPEVVMTRRATAAKTLRSARAAAKGLTAKTGKYILARGDKARLSISDYVSDKRLFAQVYTAPVSKIEMRYRFWTFYQPYVCDFIKELNWHGLDGLFARDLQLRSAQVFKPRYSPTALVDKGDPALEDHYPVEDVDFSPQGAYAQYNWELFFHAPLLIANRLMQNQRFADAQRWFHYIFDPTDTSANDVPRKYWRTRPFFEESKADYLAQRIDRLIELAARGVPDEALDAQIREWRDDPFDPHAIARLRLAAYQKNVVMKYLDNLIGWGDQLYRRNTIESINMATQLYVLAAEILGPPPATIPPRATAVTHTYASLDPQLDHLSDKLVEIEQVLPPPRPDSVVVPDDAPPLSVPKLLYFCVPPNDKLLGYWRVVSERLFNIRHCMNMAGQVQQLPLFEPPIEPGLLVRARAAGIDLTTALADIDVALPAYRYRFLAQRALELAQELKGLGASILAALEKRDGEDLGRLRASHEIALNTLVMDVREAQVDEAADNIDVLRAQRKAAAARYTHYQQLLGASNVAEPAEGANVPDVPAGVAIQNQSEDGIKANQYEVQELAKLDEANDQADQAAEWEFVSALLSIVPNFSIDAKPWGIGLGISFGGTNLAGITNAFANRRRSASASAQHEAVRASRLGSYLLRENDWALQSNIAAREIMAFDRQIIAAQVRKEIAEYERDAQQLRVDQAKEADTFLRTKYTNRELYDWMVGQLATVFFQAYQLAYDLAKKAEKAYRFELGVSDSSFIQFGYWDSLKQGLLSGERLALDLKRMEASFYDQNRRELELTKYVSIALLNPEALVALQERGACTITLPEEIFDLDNPGLYMRRIKSVSVTIPCVAGPYTPVSCKLTLLGSRIRKSSSSTAPYGWTGPTDPRFVNGAAGLQSIVTSTARQDSGTFELDFRDERYFPFEGAGAISTWRLELPASFRQFDYRTMTDIVLQIRYTARDGGDALKVAALGQLGGALRQMEIQDGKRGLYRLFSFKHDFPDEWYRFLHPPDGAPTPASLEIQVPRDRFPVALAGQPLKIKNAALFMQLAPGVVYDDGDRTTLSLAAPGRAATPIDLAIVEATLAGLPAGSASFGAGVVVADDAAGATWVVKTSAISAAIARVVDGDARLDPDKVGDLGFLCQLTF